MIEVREAPVPVQYQWMTIGGCGPWFGASDVSPKSVFTVVENAIGLGAMKAARVILSNGQTVIVRAKK